LDTEKLRQTLEEIRDGQITVDKGMERLRKMPYENISFACLDHHRALRQGFPEVVFCQGKSPDQVAAIMERLSHHHRRVLGTRASREVFEAVRETVPDVVYHELPRLLVIDHDPGRPSAGKVLVVSAGTADLPVAEEAAVCGEVMGLEITRLYDVGVAGLHRLLGQMDHLHQAQAIIVVAGMEGALASVVGGLTSRPVIAVPTSVGYGANFGGLSALLTMLNSCAVGVGVVNIDNGFGAAALAHAIVGTGRCPVCG